MPHAINNLGSKDMKPKIERVSQDLIKAAPEYISETTFGFLIDLWLESFYQNLPTIRANPSITELPKISKQPCILIGGGPSLTQYNHLEMIRQSGWKHPIFCCDKMFRETIRKGIVPQIVSSVDGSPKLAQFYTGLEHNKQASLVKAVFSLIVHPKTVHAWGRKAYWFTPIMDAVIGPKKGANKKTVTWILHSLSRGKAMMSGTGQVGSFLWNLAAELDASPIILVGFDFSEQVQDKADAVYFQPLTHMFLQETKGDVKAAQDKAALLHQVEENPDFHRFYLVNPIWKRYRETLKKHITSSKIHTINCTENGCLHTQAITCKNFEAMPLEKALKKYSQ